MTRPGQAPGPFDTEQQARQLPAVRAVYDAFDRDPGVGKMAPPNLRMLLDALAGAGSTSAPTTSRSPSGWPGGSRRRSR